MVEFVDGSTIAQASPPDMRLPIALALGWPDRVPGAAPSVDWTQAQELDVRAARRRRRSPPSSWPGGRPGRRLRAGGVQRGERGAGRRLPRRTAIGFLQHRGHGGRRTGRVAERSARRTAGNPGTVEDVEHVQRTGRAACRGRAARPIGRQPDRRDDAAVLYALGVLIFAVGLLLSIALHEIGHMVPAKKFGVKVTQYMVGFGRPVVAQARRHRVRLQGDPARRLHPDDRHGAAARGRQAVALAAADGDRGRGLPPGQPGRGRARRRGPRSSTGSRPARR